jgi:hypothetical protein
MKNIFFLLFLASTVMISACATTETSEAEDSSATEATSAAPADTTESAAPAATETAAEETPAATAETTESAPSVSDSASDHSDRTWVCTHNGSTRTIKVVYHDEGPKVCEVIYEKSSGTQSLWNANNDKTYCEDKAIEFVTKQEGWGWSCNQQ